VGNTLVKVLSDILLSHTTYGKPGGLYLDGPTILVLPMLAVLVTLFVASMVWVYRDAVKREKNPIFAMLFVLLTGWPGSFIWWFWLRPPLREDSLENEKMPTRLPPVPSQ
jgi:pimeloyl-ACP methyl ester carboxylesterase